MPTRTDERTRCANCGEQVPTADWHPAAAETTAAGDIRIHSFCSGSCRANWADRTAPGIEK